jgi:hypothetical protein
MAGIKRKQFKEWRQGLPVGKWPRRKRPADIAFLGPAGRAEATAGLPEALPDPSVSAASREAASRLGLPLGVVQVAYLIGCSPWTVRQTLIPQGLPVFRSAASGKLIFYTNQVVRWIERKQQGGM